LREDRGGITIKEEVMIGVGGSYREEEIEFIVDKPGGDRFGVG
jgi:hypothetical protein